MKYGLIILFCLFTQFANGQVVQAKAFVKMSAPGTIRAGEGKRLIIHRFIYIETSGKEFLSIKKISANRIVYKHSLENIDDNSTEIGRLKANGTVQYFRASKRNRVWKIIIYDTTHKMLAGLRIHGRVGNKNFNYLSGKEIQLAPDLYP